MGYLIKSILVSWIIAHLLTGGNGLITTDPFIEEISSQDKKVTKIVVSSLRIMKENRQTVMGY